jgi:hypothetical protein
VLLALPALRKIPVPDLPYQTKRRPTHYSLGLLPQ